MSKAKGFLLSCGSVAAMAFLLSCSDPLKPIERETLEQYLETLSSSDGAANLSSSSEAANSSSAVSSSSEEPSSSSNTVIPSSSSSVPLCGKTQYDPGTQFCHNNNYIVEKCGGKEFNPPEEVCSYGVVGKMCGSTWYNLQTHFCFGGTTPTLLCGGNEYTGSQFCRSGKVYDKCGSIGEYDPSKFYCHNGSLSSCGNLPLNPDTQFCYNSSKVGEYCGARAETYDPDLYQCKSQINPNGIYLKSKPKDAAGKEYEAVLIGTQTWMAENLNYAVSGSKCYGEGGEVVDWDGNTTLSETEVQANCMRYGRLYDWSTAIHSLICPSGWHLPSDSEWDALVTFAGGAQAAGTKLKAVSGWNNNGDGTDDYGFSALPGGIGNSSGSFSAVGDYGNWRSAMTYYWGIYDYFSGVDRFNDDTSGLFSVRCVKD